MYPFCGTFLWHAAFLTRGIVWDIYRFHVAVGNEAYDLISLTSSLVFGAIENRHCPIHNMTLLLNLHALFTVIVVANLSTRCSALLSGRDFCSTPAPDESLRAEHRRLYDLQDQRGSTAEESREVVSMIEIETWFHIVSSNEASDTVSDDMITSQVRHR